MQAVSFEEALEQILAKDRRYHRDAYLFLREALDHTQKTMIRETRGKPPRKHVSGQELLSGIRDYALEQFGPMAMAVFEEWGIHSCQAFGDMVFLMVELGLLAKTEKDSRADFEDGYDFHDAFRKPFLPKAGIARSLRKDRTSRV